MSVPKTLLLDTNVWISFFIEGDTSHDETVRLLEEATRHNITLSYTASTLKDVFYIVPRRARAQAIAAGFDVSNATFSPIAWACAEKMTEIAVAVGQSLPECSLAWMLRSEHPELIVHGSWDVPHGHEVTDSSTRFGYCVMAAKTTDELVGWLPKGDVHG